MDLSVATLIFAGAWYTRYRYDRSGAATDFKLFISLWIAISRLDPQHTVNDRPPRSHFFVKGYCCFQCACLLGLCLLCTYPLTQVFKNHGQYTSQSHDSDGLKALKPMIFPCRTSHTRLFPQKHSFSYSYLFVGIPVGWRGCVSSLLTADLKNTPWKGRKPENGWFSVDSADYLARGDSKHGLRGKLDTCLESQNEKVGDYPYAYLVTAPRFLGYSFNPVSFWYLYNIRKKLKAMILEVNNTFDERRIYFLKDTGFENGVFGDENGDLVARKNDQNADQRQDPPVEKMPRQFAKSWQKDFHVSPFNSRKGAYSLSAHDPFYPHLSSRAGAALVNNTITLSSSKQHPKLIARIFSSSDSIDPYELTRWDTFQFISLWWWVGLVTFPRIVREAGKLFFRRKLHVWFRPEVLPNSIGRNETEDEKAIAAIFRDYIKTLVESSDMPFALHFQPGIATMPTKETLTPYALREKQDTQQCIVTFKVTSPLFYAQVARCASIHEYFKVRLSKVDHGAATFHTSHPDLLTKLFKTSPSALSPFQPWPWRKAASVSKDAAHLNAPPLTPTPRLDLLRWLPIHLLRRLPSSSHHNTLSDLDTYAAHLPRTDLPKARAYRKAVLKLLLSDYVAFGMPAVIDAALWIVRIWLCWLCVKSFYGVVGLCDGRRPLTVGEVGKVVLGCLGVHLWRVVGLVL